MTVKQLQTAINNDEEVEYMSVHYKAIGYQLMKRKGVKSQSAILQDLKTLIRIFMLTLINAT